MNDTFYAMGRLGLELWGIYWQKAVRYGQNHGWDFETSQTWGRVFKTAQKFSVDSKEGKD